MRRPTVSLLLPIAGIFITWFHLHRRAISSPSLYLLERQDQLQPLSIPWPGHPPVKVYSPSKYNATVAICLIVRQETVYVDEWADFHVALGFSPIWIYDNNDTPDLELQMWHGRRTDINQHVHIVHMPLYPVQGHAYEQCIRQDAAKSTFAAMIDIDEFVVLKKHDNIVDLMVEKCDEECGQLSLNWNPMGTSNETKYSTVPVTKRNIHIHNFATNVVKAIVRPSYVADYMDWSHTVMLKKGHWVDTSGKVLRRIISTTKRFVPYNHPTGPRDVGLIYHYKFKSEEEFYTKSCLRGDSLLKRGDMTKCTHMSNRGNFPRDGTAYDDGAWQQLKRHVPKYAIFDQMSNVSLY